MNRNFARLLLLSISIGLLSFVTPTPRASAQPSSEPIKAYFSATPIAASDFQTLPSTAVWPGYASKDFASANQASVVSVYERYVETPGATIYIAFYVQSDPTYSPMDYVALYLDMANDSGSELNGNDYKFIVQRDGTKSDSQGGYLGGWNPVSHYPGTWAGSTFSNLTGWGALVTIQAVTTVGDGSMMRVGFVQSDSSMTAPGTFPGGFLDPNPATWGTILFTKTEVVFDSSPRVSSIVVGNDSYNASQLPRSFRWTREENHSFSIPEASIAEAGARYSFTQWSDGSTEVARSFIVSGEANFTAEFATEYYLTVSSPYGSPTGEGWYQRGANGTFTVSSPEDYGNWTRHVFNAWTGDCTSANTSDLVVMDAPRNVTALWKTQYHLAIEASGGEVGKGEGWYDEGSIAFADAPPYASVTNQSRLVFMGWSGDFNSTEFSISVPMDEPHSLTANWKAQYYLTLNAGGGVAIGEGWYDNGTDALLNATSLCNIVQGESQLAFTGWSGSLNASAAQATIRMDAYKSVNATWKTQWYLAVNPGEGVVNGSSTQIALWVDNGTSVVATAASPCKETPKNTRLVFTGWSGASNATTASVTVMMDNFRTLNATWRPQYYLAVVSEQGGPKGEGWYDAGAQAPFSITSPVGFLVQQVFEVWTGDSTATTSSTTVVMNGPKSVTARWATDYTQLIVLVAIICLAVVIVALLRLRRTTPWD